MEGIHRIVLELGGGLDQKTYHQHVTEMGLKPEDWRPATLGLIQSLRYGVHSPADPDAWLEFARSQLSPYLGVNCGTIAQKLSKYQDLAAVLTTAPSCPQARFTQ